MGKKRRKLVPSDYNTCHLFDMCFVLACQMLDNNLPSSTKHPASNGQANVKWLTYAWNLVDNCLVMLVNWLSSAWQASIKHKPSKQHTIDRQPQADDNYEFIVSLCCVHYYLIYFLFLCSFFFCYLFFHIFELRSFGCFTGKLSQD